jgi:hypothetical protein
MIARHAGTIGHIHTYPLKIKQKQLFYAEEILFKSGLP